VGYARRVRREAAKKAYKQFCRNFNEMKRNAEEVNVIDAGTGEKVRVSGGKREDNLPLRKPKFSEWLKAVKKPKKFETPPEEVVEHIDDVGGWDED